VSSGKATCRGAKTRDQEEERRPVLEVQGRWSEGATIQHRDGAAPV